MSFIDTAVADLKKWAGEAVDEGETVAEDIWGKVSPVITAVPAAIWAKLVPQAQAAVAKVGSGSASVESIGATLLNEGEEDAVTILQSLPAELFQAVVSALIAAVSTL